MIQRNKLSLAESAKAATQYDGGLSRPTLENQSGPDVHDDPHRIVDENRIRSPATQVQRKLAHQRPDLGQGVLLTITLDHGPPHLLGLEKHKAQQAGAEQECPDVCLPECEKQQPDPREPNQQPAHPAPGPRSPRLAKAHQFG
jgi:hypothetical protein